MAIFTLEEMYRKLPRIPSAPLLELTLFFKLTPLLESASLCVYPSPREECYFYTRNNLQVTSTIPLDPIIRADYILQADPIIRVGNIVRVHFIMTLSFTERGRLLPPRLSTPLSELTTLFTLSSSLEFTQLCV